MFDVWNVAHQAGHCERLKSLMVERVTFVNIVLIHITREIIDFGGYL